MRRVLLASAVVVVVLTTGTPAKAAEAANAAERDNPLLATWSGPHGGMPPLDRVRVEDLAPALHAGMALQRRDVAAITHNPAPPSFENTLVPLERSGDLLWRAQSMYYLWTASVSSPAMRELERQMQPELAAYDDELNQNSALFARIDAVYQSAEMKRLTSEQQRLVWSYRTALVKQGARLDAAAKRRVAEINQSLAALQTEFRQNLLADEQKEALVIADPADLAGLTPDEVAALAREAQRRALKDRWVVANTRSAMEPFLHHSPRRELRRKAWTVWTNRGEVGEARDNNRVVGEILTLRAERSKLLGFASYAHWKLSDAMAREPQTTLELMVNVWRPAVQQLRQQIAQMQALADTEQEAAGAPQFALEPWDLRYYAEKLRAAQYSFDANQLTPYLQLDKVREAMFWAAGRLYGLRFEQVTGVPVFDSEVTVYRVFARDGHHVGLWYFDPYAREGKSSGAWMRSYRLQQRLIGDVRPIVSNTANFRRGRPDEPVLISWDDATIMFHEFGHALHGLLSNVTYASLAGPSSVSDFGEVPSVINQYWLPTPAVLGRLVDAAGHPLPRAMVDRLLRTQNFEIPFARTEYLASALLDMKLHLLPDGVVGDLRTFEKVTLDELGMPSAVVARHRIPQFAHVFSFEGYAAGYYGYLWADVLARDAFGAFVEAGDPFDASTAKRYLRTMLSVGNTIDPGEAFRRFRGRNPQTDALLKAEGLAP